MASPAPAPPSSPSSDPSATAQGSLAQHLHPADLRGVAQLATEATVGTSHLVEAVHAAVLDSLRPGSADAATRTRGLAGFIYRSVRRIAEFAGLGSERLMAALEHAIGPRTQPDSEVRERFLSILNGILGDHLATSDNPLARPFTLRTPDGTPFDLDARGDASLDTLVIFVHGLCLSDRDWVPTKRGRPGHVEAITTAVDGTAVLARYNTGRSLSENGHAFATHLDRLTAGPNGPSRIVFVAHSMGGLVIRSACRHARRASARWPDLVTETLYLGSPHRGAPLESMGKWIEKQLGRTPFTAPFATLANRRSQGIQDLRDGAAALDDDSLSTSAPSEEGAPPSSGRVLYAAGVMATDPLLGDVLGDGLVPVSSALDIADPPRPGSRRVFDGRGHFDLLHDPDLTQHLCRWLSGRNHS